jgi:hypothetical protein
LARYEVKKIDGRVSEIRIFMTAEKKVLVLDRFIDGEQFVKREQGKFSTAAADPACISPAGVKSNACEQTCYWASSARPFARARMKNARGQLLWQWQAKARNVHLALLSVPSQRDGSSGHEGCLSPDQKYLAVTSYLIDADSDSSPAQSQAGYAIVKLVPGLAAAKVTGKKSGEAFGHKRFTRFIGWKTGEPHTVIFDIARPEKDNVEVIDEGVPNR